MKQHLFAKTIGLLAGSAMIVYFCEARAQPDTNSSILLTQIHLSISASNTVVRTNSTMYVRCKLDNASTNTAFIHSSGRPQNDCRILLLDASGKERNITPPDPNVRGRWISVNHFVPIKPEMPYEWEIPVQFPEVGQSTDYYLKIQLAVGIGPVVNGNREVYGMILSNPLRLKIQ
jgi:hypothetical protein